MKKSFRLLAGVLTALLCLGAFSGCTSSDNKQNNAEITPMQLYSGAYEKTQNAKSMDFDMEMDIEMTAQGETMNVSTVGNSKMDISDAEAPKMSAAMTMAIPLQGEVEMNMTFVDGYFYMDTMGQKIKSKADLSLAQKMMGNNNSVQLLNPNDLMDIKAKKDGENTILTFTCKTDATNDLLNNMLAGSLGATGGSSFTYKKFEGYMVVDKDGMVKDSSFQAEADMTVSQQTMSMNMEMKLTINSIGEPVTIAKPADADSYTEVDSSALEGAAA